MMTERKHTLFLIIGVAVALSFLTSCSSYIANREQGFNMIQQGFSSIEPTPGLHKELTIKNIKVIIVGERKQFGWQPAATDGSPIIGYATPANEIWVFGKLINGKIVVNEAVLGHELAHLLNFADAAMANPDQLTRANLANYRDEH